MLPLNGGYGVCYIQRHGCNGCVVRGDTYLDVYVIVLSEVTEEKSSIEENDQLYFVAVVEQK